MPWCLAGVRITTATVIPVRFIILPANFYNFRYYIPFSSPAFWSTIPRTSISIHKAADIRNPHLPELGMGHGDDHRIHLLVRLRERSGPEMPDHGLREGNPLVSAALSMNR